MKIFVARLSQTPVFSPQDSRGLGDPVGKRGPFGSLGGGGISKWSYQTRMDGMNRFWKKGKPEIRKSLLACETQVHFLGGVFLGDKVSRPGYSPSGQGGELSTQ